MTINIFHILLATICIVSSSLFGLVVLPVSQQDGILILSLIVLLFYAKEIDKKAFYEDRHFYYFFLYSFFVSIIMSYLNFNQPPIYTMRAARLLLAYSILLIALNILLKNFQINRAYPFIMMLVTIIASVNLYVYFTGDTSMLQDSESILKRLGEIRISIGMFTAIIFTLYFYHKLKEERWLIVPMVVLLFVLVAVAKTRSVVFPLLVVMLIPLLRAHKAQVIKVWLVLILIAVVSFIATGYEKSILTPVMKLLELLFEESQTTGKSNVNIRALEIVYFWSFLDIKSIIFGFGFLNTQFADLYNPHFFLSDIGLFKVFYLSGIVGLILYFVMLWRIYSVSKVSDSPLHLTGRAIVYLQILAPSTIYLYTPEYMFLVFVIYILIKNRNKSVTDQTIGEKVA